MLKLTASWLSFISLASDACFRGRGCLVAAPAVSLVVSLSLNPACLSVLCRSPGCGGNHAEDWQCQRR